MWSKLKPHKNVFVTLLRSRSTRKLNQYVLKNISKKLFLLHTLPKITREQHSYRTLLPINHYSTNKYISTLLSYSNIFPYIDFHNVRKCSNYNPNITNLSPYVIKIFTCSSFSEIETPH